MAAGVLAAEHTKPRAKDPGSPDGVFPALKVPNIQCRSSSRCWR